MSTRRFGPYHVETSNEGKVLFPADRLTKGDLIGYYVRVAGIMLPHLRGRPLTLHRFPDGIAQPGFYQKEAPEYFPAWIRRTTVAKQGGEVTHVLCENAATLVYLADQACITPHVWLSRDDQPEKPDRMVLDLDPSDDDFEKVRQAARLTASAFDRAGLAVYLQLTGSRGIRLVAPLRRGPGFEEVRELARAIAGRLAAAHPALLTVEPRKPNRGDRVYLDTARNAYAQTMVAPYAVRALPGAPVATPIARHELDDPDLHPRRYSLESVLRRLAERGDPWRDMSRYGRVLKPERVARWNPYTAPRPEVYL